MTAFEWLTAKAPGVGQLNAEEKQEIADFSLLWSFFELHILDCDATGADIAQFCTEMNQQGKIDLAPLIAPIAYWRQRYYAGGQFTYHFDNLHFRVGRRGRDLDNEAVSRAVLSGQANAPEQQLLCALSIAWRYRNNLFHGTKWQYDLQGQLENFRNANVVLIAAMDMAGVGNEA
jgi:hypothetical protein